MSLEIGFVRRRVERTPRATIGQQARRGTAARCGAVRCGRICGGRATEVVYGAAERGIAYQVRNPGGIVRSVMEITGVLDMLVGH